MTINGIDIFRFVLSFSSFNISHITPFVLEDYLAYTILTHILPLQLHKFVNGHLIKSVNMLLLYHNISTNITTNIDLQKGRG